MRCPAQSVTPSELVAQVKAAGIIGINRANLRNAYEANLDLAFSHDADHYRLLELLLLSSRVGK
jgi:hypothetical protein